MIRFRTPNDFWRRGSITLFVLLMLPFFCFSQEANLKAVGALYNAGKLEEAIAAARVLNASNPDHPFGYSVIGRVYVDNSQFDSAVLYLRKAISLDRDRSYISGWSHAYLGKALVSLGDTVGGLAELNKAIELKATDNSVRYAHGVINVVENYRGSAPTAGWVRIEGSHISYNFEDTAGRTSAISDYIQKHEAGYEYLERIFEPVLPRKPVFYVWDDGDKAEKILGSPLGFTRPVECLTHAHFNQTIGHEMTHTMAYWAWGKRPMVTSKFVNEGIAVCFDLTSTDKYAVARKAMKQYGFKNVMDVWLTENKCDAELLYPVAGAFMHYVYKNSTAAQYRAIVQQQTIENAKVVFGSQFDTIVDGFNALVVKKR